MTRRKEIIALIAILALGAFFRFYQITEIPPGLYPDEAANGNNALEALESGRFKVFYPENNGREGLFINIQALAIKLFGAEPWALRLASAVFGTFTILGLYLLTRELFYEPPQNQNSKFKIQNDNSKLKNSAKWTSKILHFAFCILHSRPSREKFSAHGKIALLASFFLATSYWHINFSRIGFRAIMVPFFAVFAMYWLLKTLRTGKISSAALGGIAAGLGFHTYIAFRFMPFVLAVPVVISLARWWRNDTNIRMHTNTLTPNPYPLIPRHCVPCVIALFLFITLVAALPIGFYFLQHPADFFGRGGQVSIFSAEAPLAEFAKSTVLTLGMFNVRGDCNARHNFNCQPQLFWPVGALFLIGFILVIYKILNSQFSIFNKISNSNYQTMGNFENWKLKIDNSEPLFPYFLLLLWFGVLMLPATLTREGLPHALRSIGLIPPVMILAGLGAARLWQAAEGYFSRAKENPKYTRARQQIGRIRAELAIVAVLVLVVIAGAAGRDYFIRFANSAATYNAFAVDLWHQGQYLAALPDGMEKFVIVNLSGDDIRGVPAPAQTIMFATQTFGERRRAERNVRYVRQLEDITLDGAGRIAIIPMNGLEQGLTSRIRERFPGLEARIPDDFLVFEN